MSKYRKKPVVIEAVQLREDTLDEITAFAAVGTLDSNKPWFMKVWPAGILARDMDDSTLMVTCLVIPTLEGDMTAVPDDWIIKGVKGEFYPCKPDIFEATYEKVEEPDAN